mgnify:CR=1 FL=1
MFSSDLPGARPAAGVFTYAQKRGLESGFSILWEAVTAVDGPALSRLERNFARFAAVGTDCLMELAGAVLERTGTPARVSLFHVFQPCR